MQPRAFYKDGTPFSGADTIELIKRISPGPKILSFSCGKDSIAAWLVMREHFEIIPFYMYLIPDLEFIEESVRFYEDWFDTKIIRVPHPSLYRMLNNFVWQPPERVAIIRAANYPNFTYDQLSDWIGEDHGLSEPFTATGVRAADSPNRRSSINTHGPITWSRRYFYPVWDMKIADLEALFEKHNVTLPIDYKLFGRSFDGLDHRFLHIIKRELPRDYERILEWFPFADFELMSTAMNRKVTRQKVERKRVARTRKVRPSKEARILDQMFNPQPGDNPLDGIEQTGDLETDAMNEAAAIRTGFKERAQREQERFELATDSEYWFSVVFQSRRQKETFLQALGWLENGDKYLNGLILADIMGIELPKVQLPKPKRASKRMARFVKKS